MVRAWLILMLLPLSGCLDGNTTDATESTLTVPTWHDVQAAPEGFSGSEVSMAVDPNNPLHVVASAHAGGFGVYETFDGGKNWTAERLTAVDLFGVANEVPASVHLSLSDPAVAFGPNSELYIAGLAFIPTSAVFVAERTDAGWVANTVWHSEVAATMNDKEWLAVNPVTGTIVVAWQREPAMDQLRSVEQIIDQQTGQRIDIDAGLIIFSRSTDGGQSWSLPETVSHGFHANGTQVAFAADGTGYMAWVDYEDPHLDVMISRDDGATWADLTVPSDISIVGSYANFGRMHTLPGMAVDGEDVYLVWHDDRHGDADIMLAHSSDGATSWNVHRVPDGQPGDGNIQLYPWVAADSGMAWVSYYSASEGDANFTYNVASFSGTFGNPETVSNASFELFSNHRTGAANIGDYTATAVLDGHVYAAWADPRGGPSFVHVASLR